MQPVTEVRRFDMLHVDNTLWLPPLGSGAGRCRGPRDHGPAGGFSMRTSGLVSPTLSRMARHCFQVGRESSHQDGPCLLQPNSCWALSHARPVGSSSITIRHQSQQVEGLVTLGCSPTELLSQSSGRVATAEGCPCIRLACFGSLHS